MNEPAQLTLGVQLADEATLDNFLPSGGNAGLLALLQQQLQAHGEKSLYLHGPSGSGRSHLLQAACHSAAAGSALYLPLAELGDACAADLLSGIEHMALVCLDDLHCVAGRGEWEQALFHFLNRARDSGCSVLVSADRAPRQLPLQLEDLRSRLSWGVVYQLQALNDPEKVQLLQFRATRRGLELNLEVAQFILNRAGRSPTQLMQVLDQLDKASLAQQRHLSIPFVKQSLGW